MNDVNTEVKAVVPVTAEPVKPEVGKFVQTEKEVGNQGAPKAAPAADVK